MSAKSKTQLAFMNMVKRGRIKKKGLSKDEASEFVDSSSYKDLPDKVSSKKKSFMDEGTAANATQNPGFKKDDKNPYEKLKKRFG